MAISSMDQHLRARHLLDEGKRGFSTPPTVAHYKYSEQAGMFVAQLASPTHEEATDSSVMFVATDSSVTFVVRLTKRQQIR